MDNQFSSQSQENLLASISCNIILPVLVLQHLHKYLGNQGPLLALIVALLLPLLYSAFIYMRFKKKSFIAVLGIIHVLFTGTLAIIAPPGIWWAIKDAAFPLLIGLFVFGSAFTTNPFIKMLVVNPQAMNIDLIKERMNEPNETVFFALLKNSTILLAGSFFLSSFLNFFLAQSIFTDIDPTLSDPQRTLILNEQIARMTWRSFLVIMLPSMICLLGIIWYLLSGIQKITGLKFEQIFQENTKSTSP